MLFPEVSNVFLIYCLACFYRLMASISSGTLTTRVLSVTRSPERANSAASFQSFTVNCLAVSLFPVFSYTRCQVNVPGTHSKVAEVDATPNSSIDDCNPYFFSNAFCGNPMKCTVVM